MTTAPVARAGDEARVLVPCGPEHLSAVLTHPTAPSNGCAMLYFAGRWSVTSIGRSRLWVYLARELAPLGFHSLRIDYLGIGESTGEECEWRLDAPFTEEPAAALAWLQGHGLDDAILVGTCGGARIALESAQQTERVRGVVLFAPPMRDYAKGERIATLPLRELIRRGLRRRAVRGLTDARSRRRYWHHLRLKARRMASSPRPAPGLAAPDRQAGLVTSTFLDPLEAILGSKIPVLFVFGELDSYYEDFCRGRAGPLGKLLDEAGDLVTVELLPGRFHGLAEADLHRLSSEAVRSWAAAVGLTTG